MKQSNQRWSLDKRASADHVTWLFYVATTAATVVMATTTLYYWKNLKNHNNQQPNNNNNRNQQNPHLLRMDRDKSLESEATEQVTTTPRATIVVHQQNPTPNRSTVGFHENVLIINNDDNANGNGDDGKGGDDELLRKDDPSSIAVLATTPSSRIKDQQECIKHSSLESVVATTIEEEELDAVSQDTVLPLGLVVEEPETESNSTRSTSSSFDRRRHFHAHTAIKDGPLKSSPAVSTEKETDDEGSSLATANWIHSPLRFSSTKTMKQRVKNLGKKLHKISTKRRLQHWQQAERNAIPQSSPIYNFCPESTA